jgi:hypothetical protein
MRVNISPYPKPDRNYDLHLPVTFKNAGAKQVLEIFKDISKDTSLVICENGGPPAWSEYVTNILIKNNYVNTTVDRQFDYEYFNTPSTLFPDPKKPYACIHFTGMTEKIKDFFEFYKSQTWEIEEPTNGITGHYYRGRLLWTQIQKHSDITSSKNYKLMARFNQLLPEATGFIERLLKQHHINIDQLKSRITLRLMDYVNIPGPGPGINHDLRDCHIDGCVFTGILYHDNPTIYVQNYLDDSLSLNFSELQDISDWVSNGMFVYWPGSLLCDELRTWVPGCWHGVQIPDHVRRRLSLVVRIEGLDL